MDNWSGHVKRSLHSFSLHRFTEGSVPRCCSWLPNFLVEQDLCLIKQVDLRCGYLMFAAHPLLPRAGKKVPFWVGDFWTTLYGSACCLIRNKREDKDFLLKHCPLFFWFVDIMFTTNLKIGWQTCLTTTDGFSNCARTGYKSEVVLEVLPNTSPPNYGFKSTRRTAQPPTATTKVHAQSISQKLRWKFHSTLCFQAWTYIQRKQVVVREIRHSSFSKRTCLFLFLQHRGVKHWFQCLLASLFFVWQHQEPNKVDPVVYIYIYI